MKLNFGFIMVLMHIIFLSSCVPPKAEVKDFGPASQDFSKPIVKQIYLLQNQQNFDSLAYFIKHENPMARFCAVRAFGSFTTPKAVPLIREALRDTVLDIRAEAAYVAGQLKDSTLANDVLQAFQTNEKDTDVNNLLNRNVLEAIGKIGNKTHLNFLSSSEPYPKKYEILNGGKAQAYFQFLLRGMKNELVTEQMIKFVTEDYGAEASLMGAHYLNRGKGLNLEKYKFQILQGMIKSDNPNIRMCLASALGKSNSSDILSPFLDFLKKEKDPRVVVNGIRQLEGFEYIQIIDPLLNFLTNKDESIALEATNWLKKNGKPTDTKFYQEFISKTNNPTVRRAIKGAILSIVGQYYPTTRITLEKELVNEFNNANNPYDRANILQAIGSNPYLFKTVYDLSFKDSSYVVKSQGTELLGSILTDFLPTQSSGQKKYLAPIISKYLAEAIGSGDVGMIAAASYSLAGSETSMMKYLINKDSIISAMNKLVIPRDIEAYNNCVLAINKHFPESKMEKKSSDKFRDFDFNSLSNLGNDPSALISTSKGDIRIKLFSNLAPFTVLNFIDLSQQAFYTDKIFHRVVSNFVIQTGCPRGDGYGSEDYAIRSELSPMNYDDGGYIGMASAGKHTESTQWFITLSPTPHLNGNYTIFGKVESGLDVVQSIEIGDKIIKIEIINDVVN